MSYMDTLMVDQMINNAQTTATRVFNTPAYFQSKTYNESLWIVYNTINNTYKDYHWVMTMKLANPPKPTYSTTYYYNCIDCFSITGPNNLYQYLISGVPRNSTPNAKYLQQKAFFTVSNKFNSAKDLANYIYNGFCLAGIEAVSMYEDLADIYPTEWNGVSERTNDEGTFTIRFWSYQEDCELYFTDKKKRIESA